MKCNSLRRAQCGKLKSQRERPAINTCKLIDKARYLSPCRPTAQLLFLIWYRKCWAPQSLRGPAESDSPGTRSDTLNHGPFRSQRLSGQRVYVMLWRSWALWAVRVFGKQDCKLEYIRIFLLNNICWTLFKRMELRKIVSNLLVLYVAFGHFSESSEIKGGFFIHLKM